MKNYLLSISKIPLALIIALTVSTSISAAEVISFQGLLTDPNGSPVPNGVYNLTFRFYDATEVGVPLGANAIPAVAVTNGLFTTLITVDAAWFKSATHLGISINQQAELAPRMRLATVPYAIHAKSAGNEFGDLTIRNLQVQENAMIQGSVGIGLDGEPPDDAKLDVRGGRIKAQRIVVISTNDNEALEIHGGGFASVVDILKTSGVEPSPILRVFQNRQKVDSELVFTILRNGRVGIGEPSPAAELHVNGTTRTTVLQITSDRNAKDDFQDVDPQAVLEKVAALPLSTWVYTNSPNVRHIGPVAQDFKAAFGLGEDDKHMASVDADGVALAAIQGLNQKLEQQLKAKDDRISSLEQELAELKTIVSKLSTKAK